VTVTNEINSKIIGSSTTDNNGICSLNLAVTSERDQVSELFSLNQNYPNPFNPSTVIPFIISSAGETKLIIYNIVGQNIRTLVNAYLPSGLHEVVWDSRDDNGSGIGAGVYIYRLTLEKRH